MTTLPSNLSPVEEDDLRNLVNRIRQGNVVLFVGSGLSTEAGLPSAWDIGIELARESQYKGKDPADLPKVTQYYENRFGRERLVSRLRQLFPGQSSSEVTSYDLIAELAVFPIIVTTNWDNLIEDAYGDRGRKVDVIKTEESLPLLGEGSSCLLKLHGDFSSPPKDMVVTEANYVSTYKGVSATGSRWATLGSWLQTKTVFFVGYSLSDENIQYLFQLTGSWTTELNPHYAVMRDIDPYEREKWAKDGVRLIQLTAKDFFDWLFNELRTFANRDLETEYICNQMKMPFVEVYGPIQCGKSDLLREAQKRFRLKAPRWSTSLVTATEARAKDAQMDEFALISQLSKDIIGWEITRSLLCSQAKEDVERTTRKENKVPTKTEEERAAAIQGAERLVESFQNRQIAVFFDDMDRMSPRAIHWLEVDFLPRLWAKHFAPSGNIRIVFAGRSPTQWREWFVKQRLFQLPLSPFNEAAVSDMLRSAVSVSRKRPLDRQTSEKLVARALWLSGGHPRAIRNLLQHLAEPDRRFDVFLGSPSSGTLDYFRQHRQTLFDSHVYPAIEEVLNGLSPNLRDVVHSLAAFRHFNQAILRSVMQQEHSTTQMSVFEASQEIRNKRLLQQPVTTPLDALDPMIRYILAEWLEIHNADRFVRLNRLGASQFDDWISQMAQGVFDSEYWCTYVLNSLFHWLILVRLETATPDRLDAAFQGNLNIMPTDSQNIERSASAIRLLRKTLDSDIELFTLAESAIGKDGHEALLQKADERIIEMTPMA